jgi:hypothetical protein
VALDHLSVAGPEKFWASYWMSEHEKAAPSQPIKRRPQVPAGVAQPTKRQTDAARVAAVLDTLSVAVVPGSRAFDPSTEHLDRVRAAPAADVHTHVLYSPI